MTPYLGAKRWKPAVLQDLVFLQRGFDITKAEQKNGEIPVISSSGQSSWHSEAMVEGPGVIIGRKGSLGTVHYAEGSYWPHDTTLWSKSLQGNNPRFVYYALKCLGLERFNVGGANPTLNRNHIHGLPIHLADRTTQDSIVTFLYAYDDLIENNRRRIALLEDAARMLYREWFIHFRFPGHEHVKMANGIPEGFKHRPLGQVAVTNADSYAARALPDEIAYIDIASVTLGCIVSRTRITSAEAPGRARRKAADGDVIWSNVRPNLRAYALVLDPQYNDVFSTGFTVLTPQAVPFSWLYLFVTTDNFVAHLVNHATGAGYPAVRPDDFERAIAVVPPPRLLDLFHEATEANFRLISKLNAQSEKLAQARDLLLPRLMSGELAI
ncbi:restriction endonuclease subunit S [Humitalea sp. 24SJ18S-53]|uniref:restriction endonuclease subunit S n=1 Tax=Humitalea sp. 24SJ18S-53 TaxID=3422307 RepID=UPI003D664FEB